MHGLELDLECYPDYFLAKFYDEPANVFHSFGQWEGNPLDRQGIVNLLALYPIYTFNGNNYDILMLTLALHGATCAQLKEANDDIIVRNMRPWEFYQKWGIEPLPWLDHVDIMEVAPGVRIGLKMYMGRLHAPTLQDLPYDPDTPLDGMGRFIVADYCGNDLIGTNLLRKEIADRIALRISMSEKYKVDLRSKSDAQIAEAVIKSQLAFEPSRRYVQDGYWFHYTPPEYIRFVTPQMRELLDTVRSARFVVRDKEEAIALGYYDPDDPDCPKIRTGVRIPQELAGRDIIIGNSMYRLGIGGLHSQETSRFFIADETYSIRDIDVKSYYPSLILTMGMVPDQLGPAFSTIYRKIYDTRLKAKSEADRLADLYECVGAADLKEQSAHYKTEADGLKIVLNGTFGKLFSKWSILFAPELGIRTTVTGQLALLMLIEMMELSGIQVISANTDGIVLRIPVGMDRIADEVVAWWERATGLKMEATQYRSIYQRDVNNYIAIDTKGKVKRKGQFNNSGVLSGPQGKGPFMDICADAVVAYLKDGEPIEQTVLRCKDIRKFIVLRGVTGGGRYVPHGGGAGVSDDEVYLGKAVRWYYSTNGGVIVNRKGDKVAGSSGCMPCMKLPTELPTDIDYDKYINKAFEMLATLGYPVMYWWNSESDSTFITLNDDWLGAELCELIDAKTYKKRKAK